MRRVCNLVYAALAENRDEKGLKQLDAELEVIPGEKAVVSHNVGAIMDSFKLAGR